MTNEFAAGFAAMPAAVEVLLRGGSCSMRGAVQ
jgi:hypothetical protein